MTQAEKVLAYINVYGSITQREAIPIGVYRLSARVWDLRHAGHNIVGEKKKVRNADGSFSRISFYRLGGTDERTVGDPKEA